MLQKLKGLCAHTWDRWIGRFGQRTEAGIQELRQNVIDHGNIVNLHDIRQNAQQQHVQNVEQYVQGVAEHLQGVGQHLQNVEQFAHGVKAAVEAAGRDSQALAARIATAEARLTDEGDQRMKMSAQINNDLAVNSQALTNLDARVQTQLVILNNIASATSKSLNDINAIDNRTAAIAIFSSEIRQALADQRRMAWLEARVAARARTGIVEQSFAASPDALSPSPVDFDDQLAKLRAAAPLNFDMWWDRFEAGRIEYEKRLPSSLSTEDHIDALYFRNFLYLHMKGRVLDLGVGPLARPSYLDDVPTRLIAGLDPLDPYDPHPFPFAKSVAEYLPWPDQSFETVVAATSIDHIYLLDVALDEITRVLSPGGRLLIWAGVFPETTPYDPYSATIDPPDIYHLFHPGENWLPQLLASKFRLVERFDLPIPGGFTPSFFAYERL